MVGFGRTDTSLLGRWWWTVDGWMLAGIVLLMTVGAILAMAATPMVALHLKLDRFFFVKKHVGYLIPTFITMISVSLLNQKQIKRLAVLCFLASILLMVLTMFLGTEVKGAKRWISILGITIQPSEFAKPSFAVVSAWMFSERYVTPSFPGNSIATFLCFLFVGCLLLQPDLGMSCLVLFAWMVQFFLNGLSLLFVLGAIALGVVGLVMAYFFLPHVTSRIDRFLDPKIGDHYQIERSLEAFSNGGFMGLGPGEGIVKKHLPDAHSDFVFAVVGEEFGFVLCVAIVSIFAFIVYRGLVRALRDTNFFTILSVAGLTTQFGVQAAINMASALHLMPTKGMTLPFISYGGSSVLAMGLCMGIILGLSRRVYGNE